LISTLQKEDGDEERKTAMGFATLASEEVKRKGGS